ncbi:MAG: hypothetical protein GTO60_16665 [Gammaproteobacteria bacterium]|nr:hypothetical protein [Gammaproteobacteria bacterium]
MDIQNATLAINAAILSQIAQLDGFALSTGWYGTIIHLPDDATQQQQDDALELLQNENVLTIVANKTTATVGVSNDVILSCTELPSTFDYMVFRDTLLITSITNVPDGSLELTFNETGDYVIAIIESGGTRTGYIEIEVMA